MSSITPWLLQILSRRLGIAPQLLLQALAQLTEEMAKVAKIAGDHGISNLMLEDVEQIRRELHDKVQAVRGGVKVICRIRPFVEDDDVEPGTFPAVEQDNGLEVLLIFAEKKVDQDTLKLITEKLPGDPGPTSLMEEHLRRSNSKSKVAQAANMFRFNGRVLGPKVGQEEVQGLVQSAIDGYNAFAPGRLLFL
ncbi:klpA [Symbiodinium sp. KB8]|nr:klpA [Symbiodinium sp. KB8]